MNRVNISTTQNVSISYEIANIGERILATLIDWFILLGFAFAMLFLSSNAIIPGEISGWAIFFVIGFYDLICEITMNGQSIGKRARNIKVAKLDGSQPTLSSYLLRWMLRLVDFTITSGAGAILSILFTSTGQRLGDLAAGTTVIKIGQNVSITDTILTRIEDNYQPTYPQVHQLTDEDAAIIKEVLNTAPRLPDAKTRRLVIRKAAEQIAQKMGLAPDLAPEMFLDTVLKDYNHYNGTVE